MRYPVMAVVGALLVFCAAARAEDAPPKQEAPAQPATAAQPAVPEAPQPSYKGFKDGKLDLSVDYHASLKGNAIGNTVDLGKSRDLDGDGSKEKDEVQYLSYLWDVKLDIKYDGFVEYFLGVDSDGPAEFGAPLAGTREIHTLFGTVDYFRHDELLPQVDETWVDLYGPKWPVGIKIGLFRYDVGNSFAAPGYYANYGANLHGAFPKGDWTLHYHRPDLNRVARPYANMWQENRLGLGPNHADAHYVAGNVKYQPFKWLGVQPYVSVLADDTAPNHRKPLGPVGTYSRDVLGTAGSDFNFTVGKWSWGFEGATNFGQAIGTAGTPDIQHSGWAWQVDAAYQANEKLTARVKTWYLSGQRHSKADLENGDLYHGKNTEFSVYSPTNGLGLFDTQYPVHAGPVVFCAGGTALNFGVPRPSAAGDPFPHVNLSTLNLGADWKPLTKLTTSWDLWAMRSNEPGFGTWNGSTFALPHFLGAELDSNVTYQWTKNVSVSLLSGVFLPGSYYRQRRDDTPIYSFTARTDGHAAPAHQFELSVDVKF